MSSLSIPEVNPQALEQGFAKAKDLRTILIRVSLFLTVFSLFFGLDFLWGTLLGCSVVGINYHWTVRFVFNLLEERKIHVVFFVVYCAKFLFSMIVLYMAINDFQINPVGLLLGLSNILLAVLFFAGNLHLRSDSSDVL